MGVAMGSGSAASRAVAQIVLLDNSFANCRRSSPRAAGSSATSTVSPTCSSPRPCTRAAAIGRPRRLPFPYLPRHLTLLRHLTVGIPGLFLALAPNKERAEPHFVRRVMRYAVPSGAIAAALLVRQLPRRRGSTPSSTLAQDRTTATIALFIVGLGALVAVARPLVPWKVALIAAMAGSFVVVLAVPALRDFFALDLGASRDTLVTAAIAGAGAVAVIVVGAHTIPRRTQ